MSITGLPFRKDFSTQTRFTSIRIFVAGPSDVVNERNRLQRVLEDVVPLAEHAKVQMSLLDWRSVVPDFGRPEQVILNQLQPTTWDVFVGILWHRFGTPTNAKDPASQKEYLSGTEEEFHIAHSLWLQYERPRIMFFRCRRPIPPEELDPVQFQLVKQFFDKFAADSQHPGLYQLFDDTESFERLVRQNIIKLLLTYSEQEIGRAITSQELGTILPLTLNTLPRRILFVGRTEEISRGLQALAPEDRGWGLVIDGIGGIGKTSLAVEIAYICQERGWFSCYLFITAKARELKSNGIQKTVFSESTLDGIVNQLAVALRQPQITASPSSNDKQRALLDTFRGRRALLILDNLETLTSEEQNNVGEMLRLLPQDCKAIITSRRKIGESAITLRLEKLTWEEAKQLVQNELGKQKAALQSLQSAGESAWKKLYDSAGGSPLALLWTIGLIGTRGLSFDQALALVRDGSLSSNLMKFLYDDAHERLDNNERCLLGALSFFCVPATIQALADTAELEHVAAETVLERLQALSLVDQNQTSVEQALSIRYSLHPLTRQFAYQELANNEARMRSVGLHFARYWLQFARQYVAGSGIQRTFDRIEFEWANYEKAISWLSDYAHIEATSSLPDRDASHVLVQLAHALQLYLELNDRFDDMVSINSRVYDVAYSVSQWSVAEDLAQKLVIDYEKRGDTANLSIWKRNLQKVRGADRSQLRVFLCHSSSDKPAVRELYRRLRADGFDPWLDEESLLPGQDWQQEITSAVRSSEVVLVLLSARSVSKEGYLQKEIKYALDSADEKPEGTIFVVPCLLEACSIPQRLKMWHWVNLFEKQGYERLIKALNHRSEMLGRFEVGNDR